MIAPQTTPGLDEPGPSRAVPAHHGKARDGPAHLENARTVGGPCRAPERFPGDLGRAVVATGAALCEAMCDELGVMHTCEPSATTIHRRVRPIPSNMKGHCRAGEAVLTICPPPHLGQKGAGCSVELVLAT